MAEWLLAGVTCGVLAAVVAASLTRVVAGLPEPDDVPDDKPRYADLAQGPQWRVRVVAASAAIGCAIGAVLGWGADLVVWTLLVPVLCLLSWIDWRTRYLPTRIIAPTYAALIVLILVVSALPWGDGLDGLTRTALGWSVMGGLYLVMWLVYPAGLGYGDVRLAGLLGLGLGHLGMSATITGVYLGFLFGAVGGLLLTKVLRRHERHFPFGPFMIAGAITAILVGDRLARLVLG